MHHPLRSLRGVGAAFLLCAGQSLAVRHRVLSENGSQLRSPFALRAFIQSSICDSCQAPGSIGAGNKPALISSVMCALFQAMCLRLLSSPKLRIRMCFTWLYLVRWGVSGRKCKGRPLSGDLGCAKGPVSSSVCVRRRAVQIVP
jgi:hypothetical protein